MKITKINKNKKVIKIFFSNGESLSLIPSVFAEYNLYINKIIDENLLSEIKEANKIEELFQFAIKRLSICEYSSKKIEEFLIKKGANKKEVKKIIEKLQKFDFLNEDKLVKEICERCDIKHYGYNRIISSLKIKGVSEKEIAKIKYNLYREEKEGKIQFKILEKRYKNENDFSRKKSIFSALVGYGFSEDISLELVNKFSNSNHIHEINVLKLDYDKCFSKYSKKYKGRELNERITKALLCKGYRINDINCIKETNYSK